MDTVLNLAFVCKCSKLLQDIKAKSRRKKKGKERERGKKGKGREKESEKMTRKNRWTPRVSRDMAGFAATYSKPSLLPFVLLHISICTADIPTEPTECFWNV